MDCLARELAHGPGRAAPAQLPVRGRPAVRARHAVSRRQPARLRQRRLPAGARVGAGGGRLRRLPRRAGARCASAASIAASGSPATSRAPRSGPTRARRSGSTPSGHAVVATGAVLPGAGPRDVVRAGRGRRARRAARVGDHRGRRHRRGPVRRRHLRQPQRGHRGQLDRRGRRAACATSWSRPPPRCWRPRPPTSSIEDGMRLGARRAGLRGPDLAA